ncbi:oligopeptide/dipeptide ABC transporter, ATP-binding protein [Corynebacterium mustelae]|uniref:Oligopeptide/dipeptide ABC transporter, ATP-binding protein n=1 Tax=Corynebacterium mustelae TaxID=571915 RepID=A0A0G3GXD1_9CORY|nr:ABC transporter ATP-binding protein [Corynebacterium mustelae]AKK05170.1 oligopeptide/dipeptide ABC transporter, ATP-binding protein [Corynebacterium mustelae]
MAEVPIYSEWWKLEMNTGEYSPIAQANSGGVEPLLSLRDLEVSIAVRGGSVRPLQGVNLDIYPGETVGIVGESGSGKSMTALALMGLLPPGGMVSGGEMRFAGADLLGRSETEVKRSRGMDMGMIFQDPLTSLNPTLTIGVQLMEPLRYHTDLDKKQCYDRAIEVLKKVGMPRPERVMQEYPHQLSGGMRQRVMIAIALICQPKLLIADEPTTALDVTTQRQILDLIDSLKQEFNTAVMLITHDMGVVAGRTDRIAVMYAGRIVETGSTRAIFRKPQHQYTRSLIAALPEQARRTGQRLYTIEGRPPSLRGNILGCAFAARCPRSEAVCFSQQPHFRSTLKDQPGHIVACHFPAGPPLITEDATSVMELKDTTDSRPLLEVENVVKEYPAFSSGIFRRRIGSVHAVSDVSISVREHETLGIVGESGCGKSTLGRLIAVLDELSSGTVTFNGADIAGVRGGRRKALHRDVQMMFQDSAAAMDPRMRIDSILTEPLSIQGIGTKEQRLEKARELLAAVGLGEDALARYPHEFSGGQLQRIGLARALALDPKLIVCDEPVSALDVSVQAQVLNLMRDLQQRLGLTYVFISHDLSVVRYVSDRIGVMYLGKLVEIGPADAVVDHSRHPYTKALVESIPVADPDRISDDTIVLQGEPASAINPPEGCRFKTRCPFATAECGTEPELRDNGAGHFVACHHPLDVMKPTISPEGEACCA